MNDVHPQPRFPKAAIRYLDLMREALDQGFKAIRDLDLPIDDIRRPARIQCALVLGDRDYAAEEFGKLERSLRFRDRAGHRRDVYDGLVQRVLSRFPSHRLPRSVASMLPPRPWHGEAAPNLAKAALYAAAVFDNDTLLKIVQHQQPNGSFLELNASDNPEPAWYHDLVILHAVAAAAVAEDAPPMLEEVKKAAFYTLREVQPDHASAQPWALHAMLLHEETLPVADLLLHAAGVQSPATMDGVSLFILADSIGVYR